MPPTVYEGTNGKYEGTLFGGVKFWVHQRVPMRSTFIDLIQNNGGKIVQLEKFADVCLADHARKDAPYGSVSWKYVQDSVNEGTLLDINEYKKTSGPSQRPVGSAQPTKTTKNAFTKEEDQLLLNWVLKKERQGERPSGNKIYQEFAEKYPTHSWQSWRNRWVKHLSFIPRENMVIEEPQSSSPRRETPPPQPRRRTAPSPAPQSPQRPPESSPGAARGSRRGFTEEEDKILLKWVAKCRAKGEALNGNTIYKVLAEKYPHRSYHSWRDRWVRHLSKNEAENSSRPARESTEAEYSDQPKQRTARRETAPQIPSHKIPSSRQHARSESKAETPSRPSRAITPTENRGVAQSPNSRRRELDERKRRIRSAKEIQRVWRGYRAREELASAMEILDRFLPLAKGYITRNRVFIKPESEEDIPLNSIEQQSENLEPPSEAQDGEEFMDEFREYCEWKGVEIPSVKIQGRAVDLWDLWRVATESHHMPEYRDWEEIADSLGFNWISDLESPNLLKHAFEKHLAEFEAIRIKYENESSEDEDEEEQSRDRPEQVQVQVKTGKQERSRSTNDYGTRTEVGSDQLPKRRGQSIQLDLDSSPSTAMKRSFGVAMRPVDSSSPNKRRRYDSEDEIPETPKRSNPAGQHNTSESTANATQPGPAEQRLTLVAATKKQPLEPETQDFRFDGEGFDSDEEGGITSSQQLRSEAMLASSPPLMPVVNPPESRPPNRAPPPISVTSSESSPGFASPDKLYTLAKPAIVPPASKVTRRSLPASWSKQAAPLPAATQKPQARASRAISTRTNESSLPTSLPEPRSTTRRPPSSVASSSSRPSLVAEPSGEAVRAAIDRFISLGYHQSIVIAALKATSLVVSEAGPVMESLRTGRGIPEGLAGVWTEDDDAALRMVDETDFGDVSSLDAIARIHRARKAKDKLLAKHGSERMTARRGFLLEMEKEQRMRRAG